MQDKKNRLIITVDGPAGVGKSTLAQKIATHFLLGYLDTGAMFRTVALGLSPCIDRENRVLHLDGSSLDDMLYSFVFSLEISAQASFLLCNGQRVGEEIRSEEAAFAASVVATIPQVRQFLKEAQQHLGEQCSLVAEGRDMGTEVFPQAQCKLFLDASPEVRALRRYSQLQDMGKTCDLAVLTRQIRERDEKDRTRSIAPLRPASDAVIIDTSHLSLDEVFLRIVTTIKEQVPNYTAFTGSNDRNM